MGLGETFTMCVLLGPGWHYDVRSTNYVPEVRRTKQKTTSTGFENKCSKYVYTWGKYCIHFGRRDPHFTTTMVSGGTGFYKYVHM